MEDLGRIAESTEVKEETKPSGFDLLKQVYQQTTSPEALAVEIQKLSEAKDKALAELLEAKATTAKSISEGGRTMEMYDLNAFQRKYEMASLQLARKIKEAEAKLGYSVSYLTTTDIKAK